MIVNMIVLFKFRDYFVIRGFALDPLGSLQCPPPRFPAAFLRRPLLQLNFIKAVIYLCCETQYGIAE